MSLTPGTQFVLAVEGDVPTHLTVVTDWTEVLSRER